MVLKSTDEGLTNCLWHFARRSADIHDTVTLRKRFIYARTLLTNKVLNIDLLSLFAHQYVVLRDEKIEQLTWSLENAANTSSGTPSFCS